MGAVAPLPLLALPGLGAPWPAANTVLAFKRGAIHLPAVWLPAGHQ